MKMEIEKKKHIKFNIIGRDQSDVCCITSVRHPYYRR